MTTITPLDRYSANLALFDSGSMALPVPAVSSFHSHSHSHSHPSSTSSSLSQASAPARPQGPLSLQADYAASSKRCLRMRHRRRRLHNNRFSDRSDSDSDGIDTDSDDDELKRGRSLTRFGEKSSDCSCASGSRVMSTSRALLSDDEDEYQDFDDGDALSLSKSVPPDVMEEVERFKRLLEQANLDQRMAAYRPSLAGDAPCPCDDDSSEYDDEEFDDESDEEEDDTDDKESLDFTKQPVPFPSILHRQQTKQRMCCYPVAEYSADADPGRVVRVDHISKDIVPPHVKA
ncbi:hypothetical protein BZA70DRAFT_292243 [Myxozyma melibiosi]|uniref:Uncharacterized protein n=1 Tax=Myxozyma melibiosi TaxID=54550 RepID=A0ABR1EXZ6_9ASCO